jgi:uncharacterized protein (DUF433 family)
MQRITTHPEVGYGRPSIRGLRIPVADVLELLASGMSHEDIFADYPYLEREDITACLEFAGRLVPHEV